MGIIDYDKFADVLVGRLENANITASIGDKREFGDAVRREISEANQSGY